MNKIFFTVKSEYSYAYMYIRKNIQLIKIDKTQDIAEFVCILHATLYTYITVPIDVHNGYA